MKRIIVERVSKEFKIGFKKNQSALARVVSLFSGKEPQRTLLALDGVSFKVEAGQILGIVGENGSGKSTLLRLIAGIYREDKGRIVLNGNVISLINLYIGLKRKLTMEDNIYLLGSFLGLSSNELKQKFDLIVEFSELDDFVKTKIYQFSNGMMQRLIFSIAVHCNADILLLDEVFEVGDEHFKIKSANKVRKLSEKGTSIILVSHEMWMIQKYCDRAIWLDKGRILKEGGTESVISEYKKADIK